MRLTARAALAAIAALLPLSTAQAQTVYVSNERGNSISVIDGASGKSLATWPVGERPRGITLSKDGRFVLVCVSNDNAVKVIDRQTGKILREIGAGQDPEQFFLSQDGKTVFVANENDAAVSAIDLASGRVAFQVSVGKEPEGIAQSPDGKWLVVTSEEDNAVSWIDLASHAVVSTMETEKRPRHVEFTADGKQLWIAAEVGGVVQIADPQTRAITATIHFAIPGVADYKIMPCGIRFTPDGKTAVVALGRADRIALVDVASHTVKTTIPVGKRVWHLALNADGTRAYTANGLSNDVSCDVGTAGFRRRPCAAHPLTRSTFAPQRESFSSSRSKPRSR